MTKTPDPVDRHVGSRLRLQRTLIGFSQQKLGQALGITFQQIQKYEHGTNRIGASRLYQISQILDVPVSFFFEEMPEPTRQSNNEEPTAKTIKITDRKSLEFMRDWVHLSAEKKSAIHQVVKSMNNAPDA